MPVRDTFFQKSSSLQISIPGHSSAPRISHESGWLGRCPQLHPLCCCLLESGWLGRSPCCTHSSGDSLDFWLSDLLSSYSRPHGSPLLSSARPHLNARPGPSCMISYPALPMVCECPLFFASSPVSFTFCCLPSLVKPKVSSDRLVSGMGICPLPLKLVLVS